MPQFITGQSPYRTGLTKVGLPGAKEGLSELDPTIALGDMPGWVTFSMDGQYAYPSSGEVIQVKTRKVLSMLQDENYNTVSSEKMVEIFMEDGKVTRAGDQFGLGRLHQRDE